MEYSDKELIQQYFSDNKEAFDTLVKRYLSPVYNFVSKISGNIPETSDIVQETFLKAWKQLKRFDTEKNFKVWIFTIARNTTIDYFRKKKAIPASFFEDEEGNNVLLDSLVDTELSAEEIFDVKQTKGVVGELVGKLSPAYRAIVTMRYENDLTFQEMADVLQESIDTIKSRYRRALILLKKELTKSLK